MRRDVVTQIIVEYPSGCENFATRLEAERFINANLEEEEPVAVWDLQFWCGQPDSGNKRRRTDCSGRRQNNFLSGVFAGE